MTAGIHKGRINSILLAWIRVQVARTVVFAVSPHPVIDLIWQLASSEVYELNELYVQTSLRPYSLARWGLVVPCHLPHAPSHTTLFYITWRRSPWRSWSIQEQCEKCKYVATDKHNMEFDEKSSYKGVQGGFLTSLTGFSSPNREKRASSWILQRAPLRWGGQNGHWKGSVGGGVVSI